jgi:hypothetical protein
LLLEIVGSLHMVEFQIEMTEQHYIATVDRIRRIHPSRLWNPYVRGIAAIGLFGLCLIGAFNGLYVVTAALAFWLVLLAMGPRFDYWFMVRRFRRSPFYLNRMQIHFDERGYAATSDNGEGKLPWKVFTRVHRFDDGFLALTGPMFGYWWPDAALVEGSVAQLQTLIKTNVIAERITGLKI